MSDLTHSLLAGQRKRLVATIMNGAEQSSWWGKLSTADQRAYRDKILAAIGVYSDFCRDLINALQETDSSFVVNDRALELIGRVHDSQLRLEAMHQVS